MTKQTVSCIVPARNEADHLEQLVFEILSLVEISKVVIVEGGSTDQTYDIASSLAMKYPEKVMCIQQTGEGKFNAVLDGVACFDSEFVMIWDADGTVPAESALQILNRSLATNSLCMGDRLRGDLKPGAMQFLNRIGNWCFAFMWSPINRIRPTDIFCGTKVAPRAVFLSAPQDFILRDPYGDISLLLTARILDIEIQAVRVTYLARVYGYSKMRRWKMGWQFFCLTISSYIRILKI
jgi:glycosyltransferase involved in cell wall biosynthesis